MLTPQLSFVAAAPLLLHVAAFSTSSTMPRRLATTCAKMMAEKWAQLRRPTQGADESRVSAEVLAAEATDVNYDIIHNSSDMGEITGSEYLRQMRQPRPPVSEVKGHILYIP